ncbi:hypothetical protein LCGC14_1004350 [marine sediment metagenome]|uniref:Uncharacterized protein n=1 Tax=marine sediment metagenome TaxID=412755 RepID=A0A0F9NNH9_9ZZZZ
MNELFKIITSTIFPYEGEQYMYGIIDDTEIAFLFERNIPIIRIRNKLGNNKEISMEEFLDVFYFDDKEEEEVETEEEEVWDSDAS